MMATNAERRDEMRQDNLETAYGAPEPEPFPTRTCRHCQKVRAAFGDEDLCIVCHGIVYGQGHHPAARLTSGTGWYPACSSHGCTVLPDARLPHTDRDDAVEESRRLHREAIHGPSDGWRYSTGRGWFGNWEAI